MSDQKDVGAYCEIKAPEEPRKQVICLEQKPESTRIRMEWTSFGSLAAAACAAASLIAAPPPFAVYGETALPYQGAPTGAEPVSIPADHPQTTSGLREVSGGIPLVLEIGETARVSASGGEFSLFDPEGEFLGDGTEAEISEDVLFYWDLSGIEDTMSSLILKTNGKRFTYISPMRDDRGYDPQQNQSPK